MESNNLFEETLIEVNHKMSHAHNVMSLNTTPSFLLYLGFLNFVKKNFQIGIAKKCYQGQYPSKILLVGVVLALLKGVTFKDVELCAEFSMLHFMILFYLPEYLFHRSFYI